MFIAAENCYLPPNFPEEVKLTSNENIRIRKQTVKISGTTLPAQMLWTRSQSKQGSAITPLDSKQAMHFCILADFTSWKQYNFSKDTRWSHKNNTRQNDHGDQDKVHYVWKLRNDHYDESFLDYQTECLVSTRSQIFAFHLPKLDLR